MNKRFALVLVTFILSVLITRAQPRVILDTDIGSDCDDAGAMAVLHKLSDKGEVDILGIIYSSGKIAEGVGVCDAINTYYNRPNLPIGQYKKNDVGDPITTYLPQIGRDTARFKHNLINSAPSALETYKKILRTQPDSSVTIITIGHPHVLLYLIKDEEGISLIQAKVTKWIAMAHTQETPNVGWNFGRNGAANYVGKILKYWPQEVIFSGLGRDIITGNKKLPNTPKDNPVKEIYTLWNGAIQKGRPSWDQIAVLAAVRPQYFLFEKKGSLRQLEEGKTFWDVSLNNPKHSRVSLKIDKKEMESVIEELMSELPQNNERSFNPK